MRVALKEEGVLEDVIRTRQRRIDISELQRDLLVDVSFVAVLMNARRRSGEGLFWIGNGLERLIVYLQKLDRIGGIVLGRRDNGRDRIADKADEVRAQGVL